MDYEAYAAYLTETGDNLIAWADPEGRFSGHTKVGMLTGLSLSFVRIMDDY
jgi:hypothetical protein